MLELETKLAAMKVKIDAMKPSDWLQAMIDGLRQAKSDPHWRVDMASYGYWTHGDDPKVSEMCFGCAATATFMLMLDTPYMAVIEEHGESSSGSRPYSDLVMDAIDYNSEVDLARTEIAIDHARNGILAPLFRLCNLDPNRTPEMIAIPKDCGWNNRFHMQNNNWETEIPKVETVIAEMKLAGY
jgi:hypothetical protein